MSTCSTRLATRNVSLVARTTYLSIRLSACSACSAICGSFYNWSTVFTYSKSIMEHGKNTSEQFVKCVKSLTLF